MAAVLATGGVLSHATAAAAWDLRRTSSPLIHVTIAGDTGRARRQGVRVHRSTTLTGADTTTHRGIPITTPARTIIDHLRQANSASLKAVLSRYSPAPTRSELEERFLELCDDHSIDRPETNARIEGIEVDFVWRDRRLIVEVDGYGYHRSPQSFESDRERDVTLKMAGWDVLRFTWRQLETKRGWVAAAITGARPLAA